MIRLLVHVEGETEEMFVNELLGPHLYACGYASVAPRLLGNARQRSRRGGIRGWDSAGKDILRHLRQDRQQFLTTMVDYFALPQDGGRAWPGRKEAQNLPFPRKAITVEHALAADISKHMGSGAHPSRFIPYVMMHEFEGLLFSDCIAFASAIGRPELMTRFQAIRDQFRSPEEINDSPITAPSKRVINLVPDYQKPLMGTFAALEIGLARIRQECPLFDTWVTKLEKLV